MVYIGIDFWWCPSHFRGSANAYAQLAETEAVSPDAPKPPIATPLKWKSSGVLVRPVSDETHKIVSVKDPTVVHYDGLWHIYATAYSTSARTWSMVYLNFKDWSDAPKAKLTYIDVNPSLRGYHCAPHLFYFTPHKKWYLIFQSQQPQYCTTDDISKPETWTAPQNFFARMPASTPRLPIDYHIICDDTHAYLFFTGDNGRFYRCRTKIEDFPKGFSDPEIAIQDSRNNLFEGSMTYKIKGTNTYLTMIEATEPGTILPRLDFRRSQRRVDAARGRRLMGDAFRRDQQRDLRGRRGALDEGHQPRGVAARQL